MDRIEYAAIALSGDLKVEQMQILCEEGYSSTSLMISEAPLNPVTLKRIRRTFVETVKVLSSHTAFLIYKDEEYPDNLRNLHDPPPVIFYHGDKEMLKNESTLAVVGSRKADGYGLRVARDFSRSLSDSGVAIVSGLAVGIDAQAHEGALEAGGVTIGVQGTGIDVAYPASNRTLIDKVRAGGCIVSEFLPGTPPLKQNFPRRNRIIAGLSKAVFVVQAGLRSGSLITARLALENGRDVFALPGDIYRENSKGTNWLLKNGAKLITEYEDILEEFPWLAREERRESENRKIDSPVYRCLGNGPMTFGEILLASGKSSNELMVELTQLQLEGHVYEENGRWSRSCNL